MKVLFAAPYCLLDPSSGAAISCRTILEALAARGHQAQAVSATIFDEPLFPKPLGFLRHIGAQPFKRDDRGRPLAWRYSRDGVDHFLYQTGSHDRLRMTCAEEYFYETMLTNFVAEHRPDIVIVYGGLRRIETDSAGFTTKGIPLVFYLTVGTHRDPRPFRDVDLIITDTQATSDLYRKKFGLDSLVVRKFVKAVAPSDAALRNCATLINALPAKGAALFVAIAMEANRRALPVTFLAVQSRGNLAGVVKAMGLNSADIPNIKCLPLQEDMTGVWARTGILLSPSLWHESGSRSVVEACSGGIPVLATDSGGTAELLGDAGQIFPIPEELKEKYLAPISPETVTPWVDAIEKLVTDQEAYARASERARKRWKALNEPNPVVELESAFKQLIERKRNGLQGDQ